jgi:hypothetical protein
LEDTNKFGNGLLGGTQCHFCMLSENAASLLIYFDSTNSSCKSGRDLGLQIVQNQK